MKQTYALAAIAPLLALACSRSPAATLPEGLALELAFEGSWEPLCRAPLRLEAPKSGLTLTPGPVGDAARFDGSGAALELRGIDALGIREALTLELYLNADDWRNPYLAGGALESLVSHSTHFTLAVNPHDWSLRASLTTDAREEPTTLYGGTITPGSWHHVALLFDGQRAWLALDGEVVADEALSGHLQLRPDLGLVVGTWFRQNQAFAGCLDSIRLWQHALSPEELRAHTALLPGRTGTALDG